jgi:hypothetical protein
MIKTVSGPQGIAMNAMWAGCGRERRSQGANTNNASRRRFCRVAELIALALAAVFGLCPSVRAQNSSNDPGAPNMSGVTDVTPGWKYLLQNDDLAMVQVTQASDGTVTTSLVTMNTSNSSLSGTPQTVTIGSSNPGVDSTKGAVASEASGRIFNTGTDMVAVLTAVQNGWKFALANSTGVQASNTLKSSFPPYGVVYTQVVMGDFNGDGLADPLAFYENTAFNGTPEVQWGMMAMTAGDPTKAPDVREGPELSGNTVTATAPVAGTVVVGDFNGDGRDEIAALLNDYQTIAFYSVDPNTLAITPTTTVKLAAEIPTIGNFPITMVSGQVALAAGKFRQCGGNGSPCQSNGATNADLVVFGQIDKINGNTATTGYSVIPIKITPGSGGTGPFTATVVPMKKPTQDQPFFRFPGYSYTQGALAQAAPLVYWPQQIDEQLVLGVSTTGASSYIEIGSFLPDDGSLDTFDWESETRRHYNRYYDLLENMWVGNFDHQNPDGSHNAGWQIETYELVGVDTFGPHLNIFNVNAPSALPSKPPTTDWLNVQQPSDNTSGVPNRSYYAPPGLGFLAPSDLQGRSLRLGAPTIVRIPAQTQPDLVLAIPPMHVDYIAPNDPTLAANNKDSGGCTNATTPCVVNLSVVPSEPPSQGQGFASSFNFTSSANSSSKRSSTTSWGISTKTSVGASFSFNDGLENGKDSIKNTTKVGHDGTVKKTYGTYAGTTQSLSATTGLSDYLYFTQKAMNVYYYPVLGCDAAGASECWVDGQKVPMYVQFSVPDQVRYSDIDGLKQDWYQPVHEPGNVFSYPWSLAQLEARYTEQVNPLTGTATCMATGTSSSSYSTQWSSGHNQDSSSGSTSTFSNELSMSTSSGAGIAGVDSANFNFSLDVAGSTSLNTLNESSTSMSTSKAISVNIPQFGYAAKCCDYAFGGYVFGLQNTKNPASEVACTADQTPDKDGCVAVNDPDNGKPIDIAGTGPMFVGFLADPISSVNANNTDLHCSGSDIWWQTVYTKPDVAVNHPGRWNWNKAQQLATFVKADSTPIVEDNYFYLMKGFFIANKGNTSGPSLAEASPSDPLTLTTRVYNYSLKDTNDPTLADPAKDIRVRFYGQLYCTSSSSTETSCKSGSTTCNTPGLCGNSFQIGSDYIIPSIAGFKAEGTEPNWTTANVDFIPANFDATKNGNAYMVFWVVVWMEDASGNLAAEMPGHGLTSIPASNLTQITQEPFEPYSNNVGMYGVHQRFYICPTSGCVPQNTGLGGTQSSSALKSITISANPNMLLEQRAKVSATLQAGGPVGPVNIAYYDGNPAKDGTLLDVQKLQHMDAGATYAHRTFFTPETCGAHTLYASAWVADSPEIQASTATSVTINSVDFVQALISSTKTANITSNALSANLLALLNTALQDFQQGQPDAGNTALGAYMQQLAAASGNGITVDSVSQLTGQAGVVLGCGASGFSLTTSPSSATVSVGSPASYALAVTPIGGFTGKVSLACMGAPQGIDCSFSSASVALDGSSQWRVTITVNTNGGVSAAGIGGPPSGTSGKIKWLLMLLVAALAIASLHRARIRQVILGCVIALVLLGGIGGCGSNGSTASIQPGTYPFTLQATSGNTVRNTLLVLVVK